MAVALLIHDIRSEIHAGSRVQADPGPVVGGRRVFLPATPAGMVLQADVSLKKTHAPPNLLKQSVHGQKFFDPEQTFEGQPVFPQAERHPPAERASPDSTLQSGRKGNIAPERWNNAGLLPVGFDQKRRTPEGDMEGWSPPDWIYMNAEGLGGDSSGFGPNPTGSPAVCRFAYQMYDTGGLLDLNIAGHAPEAMRGFERISARKGSAGFCDLREIGFTAEALRLFMSHRDGEDISTADHTGPYGHPLANFLLVSGLNHRFLRGGVAGKAHVLRRAFPSRRALLGFLKQIEARSHSPGLAATVSVYASHHGLSLEQPTFFPEWECRTGSGGWAPLPLPSIVPPANLHEDSLESMETVSIKQLGSKDFRRTMGPLEMPLGNNRGGNDAWGTLSQRSADSSDPRRLRDVINPAFQNVRVASAGIASFIRVDGSPAREGEPLVKTRFDLGRLAWLTFKGPSAALDPTDPLFDAEGTPDAIHRAFGLQWLRDPRTGVFLWGYYHGKAGGIYRLEELVREDPATGRPREADFFELLKASIGAGSLGKSALLSHRPGQCWDPATYAQVRDRNSAFQIIEIGANLIDQFDADSFPTRIRLSTPGPEPGRNLFDPPLFTAAGIEDIPYLHRFHWRPIRNAAHPMKAPVENLEIPSEITADLTPYQSGEFSCGTTSLMGFPELWNPHRMISGGTERRGPVPREFRVVAASETPQDLADPLLEGGVRMGPVPYLGWENRRWITLINSGDTSFLIRPHGFFAFHNPLTPHTLTWLDSVPLRSDAVAIYNTATQSYDWPNDNIPSADLSATPSARGSCLFWTRAPVLPSSVLDPFDGQRLPQLYLGVWPVWKLAPPTSPPFQMEAAPMGWPASSGYRGKPILRMRNRLLRYPSLVDFPEATRADASWFYHAENTQKTYSWNGKTYREKRYPLGLDVKKTFGGNGFSEGSEGLRLSDGTPVPHPLPCHQKYFFALTDHPGKQRVLFGTDPASLTSPGNPPWSSGDATQNRIVDLRGSELTFVLSHPLLFREPTTLCQTGLPEGSFLQCGADNFFTLPPHHGSVRDPGGVRWVGFSLGEIPSSFLAVTKLYRRDRVATYHDPLNPAEGFDWNIDEKDPAEDAPADALGRTPDPGGPLAKQTLRVFRVPVNCAGLDTTFLSVRLQYRDALTDQWATYQERFFSLENMFSKRWNATPVAVQEPQLVNPESPQGDTGWVEWKENQRPLGWSFPVVSTYDPRCVRFGNPMQPGSNAAATVHGTTARERAQLSPGTQNAHAVFPRGGAPTNQPGASPIDLPMESPPAKTFTAGWPVPGAWFYWFNEGYNHGSRYFDSYRYASGQITHAVWKPQWWASATLQNRILLQAPTADAGDFGWHPRLRSPVPPGATRTFKGASPESSIPNFWQPALGSAFADTLRPGALAENCAPTGQAPYSQAYADADDVIRRASGAWARPGESPGFPHGFPLAQNQNSAQPPAASRPVVINRRFQSVAEMGYAFRGEPWKELGMHTPESADCALLDVFTISAEPRLEEHPRPLAAGKINLNTRQEPVLRAVLAGAAKLEEDPFSESNSIGSSEAGEIARLLIGRTTTESAWAGPLRNPAELVGKLVGKNLPDYDANPMVYTSRVRRSACEPGRNPDFENGSPELAWHFSGFSQDLGLFAVGNRPYRNPRVLQSAIRALAGVGQTRVWNVMVDVILQTLAPGAPGEPTAEVRAWVHLSVDRFTAEVLAVQWEWIVE